nr:MAG TPA: hypothetical protein [Caudoviricetes sp.]
MIDKSWLEVEMEESIMLLRKRLEKLNDIHADDVDEDVTCEIEKIYKALYYILSIKKAN